ncbi:MAG TPA: enoyl-CoA hydratase/isomerase family protein [Bacteroidetes bacterium]|nr:enoyl-CoA hydratase/isomerase family protein [Bacteroidota bacterium]
MNENQYIQKEVINRVCYITLDRPEKRNALNHAFVTELKTAFREAEVSETVRAIVLRSSGKVFCAGADLAYLRQLQANDFDENLRDSTHLMGLFDLIYRLGKPVIAQIQGHAVAGGAGLATVCDFSFSVPEAKLGYTEVRIGFIPAIVMVFLIRKCGELRAKELLLSGELIDAQTAVTYNMINRVIPADSIENEVKAFAEMLATKNSGQSMHLTKKMIGDIQHFPAKEALAFAARMNARARSSDDCKRGVAAFLDKEKIDW